MMSVKHQDETVFSQIRVCCVALDDRKAEDLRVLYLGERSSITDYLIIASGNADPHLKALRAALEEALKELKLRPIGRDADPASGWLVVDAFDFMVHLFLPEKREFYRLESLWKDADCVDVSAFLSSRIREETGV